MKIEEIRCSKVIKDILESTFASGTENILGKEVDVLRMGTKKVVVNDNEIGLPNEKHITLDSEARTSSSR